MNELTTEWTPTSSLFLSPQNPRFNDEAVDHVAASIRRFGWRQPIVARPSGEVIAGNTRLKAAHALGHDRVPVIWFEGSDLEATAYAIADNRTHEFSQSDEPALARMLQELRAEDALDAVGYTDLEIDDLLAELAAEDGSAELEDPGAGDPPANPVSRTGDLWLLGDHRLLCGDSTDPEAVARIMAGEKAVLLSTDPPYCVRYSGADRPNASGKDWSDTYREVEIEDLGDLLRSSLRAVLPHLVDSAAFYVWHAHLQYPVIDAVFEEHGILRHQPIIWKKPSSTFTYSYYRWAHEPAIFGWRKGHKPPHYLPNELTSVWEIDHDGKNRVVGNDHPTQKPLALFEIPIRQHTRRGEVVLEPFSGSGTQLLAAEKLGRRCRAIEIEPAFVDVAIRRWEGATGESAIRESDSVSFAIAAERKEASYSITSPDSSCRATTPTNAWRPAVASTSLRPSTNCVNPRASNSLPSADLTRSVNSCRNWATTSRTI